MTTNIQLVQIRQIGTHEPAHIWEEWPAGKPVHVGQIVQDPVYGRCEVISVCDGTDDCQAETDFSRADAIKYAHGCGYAD